MKNIFGYFGLLFVILVSCMEDEVPSAVLNVSLDKLVYQVGEPVVFKLNGEPDNIVFYSGEAGHNYAFRNRLRADNDLLVNFNSWVRYGDIYDNIKFLVSSDFSGIYDKENVEAATWIDLTDKVRFSVGTGILKGDQTPSGELSLKEYVGAVEDARLFIAFRYEDEEKVEQNNWIIRSIMLDCISPEGIRSNLATMATMGWIAVDFENPDKIWDISSEQIQINGGKNQPRNVDWVISQGFDIRKIASDTGIALKNVSTTMDKYTHIYTAPGTYEVVFETTSNRYNGEDSALTKVTVEVEGEVKEEYPAFFTVLPDKLECKAGEPITFTLAGNNADRVTFYSGESGHCFEFRERFYTDNDVVVNFSTFMRPASDEGLKFKISTNFDGIYEKEHVEAATWIDLSDKFTFPANKETTLPSGEISLKEWVGDDPNVQLFVAFHHKDENQKKCLWAVKSFELALISPENVRGSNQLSFSKDNWTAVDCLNDKRNWVIQSTQLLLNNTGSIASRPNDDWVISKFINLRKSNPDQGVVLDDITSYKHIYSTPGTYKAVFDWYDGSKYSQEVFTIEVAPNE